MARLEIRTNPSHATDVDVSQFTIEGGGTPTLILDQPQDIALLQRDPEFRDLLVDGAYDTGSTSTLQVIDGGVLVAQANAIRYLAITHRHDNYRQIFADATARTADATTYVATDLHSDALQLSDGSVYFLSSISPTTWTLKKAAAAAATAGQDINAPFMKDSTTPYVKASLGTYQGFHIFWSGSTRKGIPANIKVIARAKDSGKVCDIRIQDIDSGLTIAEKLGVANNAFAIVDLGTISNVSAGEALWEVQGRKPSGGSEANWSFVSVLF